MTVRGRQTAFSENPRPTIATTTPNAYIVNMTATGKVTPKNLPPTAALTVRAGMKVAIIKM